MEQITLKDILEAKEKYNIPDNCKIISNTAWECDPVEMCEMYYDDENEVLLLTQEGFRLNEAEGMIQIIGQNKKMKCGIRGTIYFVDDTTKRIVKKERNLFKDISEVARKTLVDMDIFDGYSTSFKDQFGIHDGEFTLTPNCCDYYFSIKKTEFGEIIVSQRFVSTGAFCKNFEVHVANGSAWITFEENSKYPCFTEEQMKLVAENIKKYLKEEFFGDDD